MREFHLKLILIYLNDYEDQYEFNEMKKLCNLTISQLKEYLNTLKSDGYIQYDGIVLKLLDKARTYLEDKNLNEVQIDALFTNTVTLNIDKNKFSSENIYIPKGFKY